MSAATEETAVEPLPLVLTEVVVSSVERLSPSFVRLELAGDGLADVGQPVDGDPWWDQRFKLVVPHEGGALSDVSRADASWMATWRDLPVEERGHMRTYTVREVRGEGVGTTVVVDVVVHEGVSGPGADFATAARVGDRAVVMLPRRGVPFGGIEFVPPAGAELLLVGDETAVPAICAILEHLPAGTTGAAFMEVPYAADVLGCTAPDGVEVTWLAREGRPHGEALTAAVTAYVGGSGTPLDEPSEVDEGLWETPTWSSSGEEVEGVADTAELYAWIAGEAGTVTSLRRYLVKEQGLDRSQVAFMGYWRRGVAMKS
ncbi:siderophore-interacting protein [Nocardioides daphniae]|uniref:Siderophore-interacting protein n=1 Tax=Nocardioides daphniae TaxID=402297 RepID=A0A4P7U843_9ACTN|nr:siderophore-interacting protein [Nocardioides daphniae]QCC76260.1 siderophore-interacting protein [Nocardioides daphniae]GGD08542.1 siderophore-interacting protein [Nocardioides daphniae]